jgi:hypothetical protein
VHGGARPRPFGGGIQLPRCEEEARWCGRAAHTALCSATLAVGSTTRKVAAAAARAWRWAPQRAQRAFHFFLLFFQIYFRKQAFVPASIDFINAGGYCACLR